jgi:hypothetical protein
MESFRQIGRVSVWLGQEKIEQNVDLLRSFCGIDSYSLDDQEISVNSTTWRTQSILNLLSKVSYSSSFIDAAVAAASKHGITEALYAICQFDFAYVPDDNKPAKLNAPVFIGHFPWDDSEDDT